MSQVLVLICMLQPPKKEGKQFLLLGGGQVVIRFPWPDPSRPDYLDERELRPDVVHLRKTGRGFTEEKAASGHNLQYPCPIRQFETYAFALAFRRSRGDQIPWVDYVFVRYGNRNTNGQHTHENGSLVKMIAKAEKEMVVVPFNLAAFLFMISPEKLHNQQSHGYQERGYWIVRQGLLRTFMEYEPEKACETAVENARAIMARRSKRGLLWQCDWEGPLNKRLDYLGKPRNLRKVIRDLSLEGLARKDEMSPAMVTHAGDPISPFPVVSFRIPPREYQIWLNSLMDDQARTRIFRRIGAVDLYGKLQRYQQKYGETLELIGKVHYLDLPRDHKQNSGVPF